MEDGQDQDTSQQLPLQLRCQIGPDYLHFWQLMTACVLLYFHICDTGLMIMIVTNNVTSSDTIVDITQLQILKQNIIFLFLSDRTFLSPMITETYLKVQGQTKGVKILNIYGGYV